MAIKLFTHRGHRWIDMNLSFSTLIACLTLLHFSTCKDENEFLPLPTDRAGRIITIAKNYQLPTLTVSIHTPDTTLEITYKADNPEVHPITRYGIGSTTKLLAALVVLKYVDDGKLTLDEPLSQYYAHSRLQAITWYPNITIRHLLSHTSGLPDHTQNPAWLEAINSNNAPHTIDRKIALLPDPASTDSLGNFHYSNTNYTLLESVVERLSGQSATQAFNQYYVDLGLPGIQLNPTDIENQSFYSQDLKTILNNTAVKEQYGYEGGAFATQQDLQTLLQKVFVDKTVLSPQTQALMTTYTSMGAYPLHYGAVHVDQYGLGLMKFDLNGQTYLGHPGGTLKYQCFAFINPQTNTRIILQTNGAGRNYNKAFFGEILREAIAVL